MATARIPVSGGTLQTTGADGTVYTLTVPPDALTQDTTISMTPLTGASGLDLAGGRLLGVQFAPEGLSFLHEVSLSLADARDRASRTHREHWLPRDWFADN